jgi:hypothetical protein
LTARRTGDRTHLLVAAGPRATLKDMVQGRALSSRIEQRKEWISERSGHVEVPRGDLVSAVQDMSSPTGE